MPAFALLAGVALYLLGLVAFRYRHVRSINWRRLLLGLALVGLLPAATALPALATLGIVAAMLWILVALETRGYGEGACSGPARRGLPGGPLAGELRPSGRRCA